MIGKDEFAWSQVVVAQSDLLGPRGNRIIIFNFLRLPDWQVDSPTILLLDPVQLLSGRAKEFHWKDTFSTSQNLSGLERDNSSAFVGRPTLAFCCINGAAAVPLDIHCRMTPNCQMRCLPPIGDGSGIPIFSRCFFLWIDERAIPVKALTSRGPTKKSFSKSANFAAKS